MTRDEFEASALLRLQHLYPQARFLKAGQLEIAILRSPSGRPTAHRLRLSRAWAAFCQNGERFDMDTYLTRVVGTIEHRVPADWETARPLLFPKLLTSGLVKRQQKPLFYPLAGEVGYVLTCSDFDIWITPEHLQTWQIPEECVLAAAMENLERLWNEATVVAWTIQDTIRAFHVEMAHGHKAAFVLAPQFQERAAELLHTDELLVAIPNRNFLVTFGADDDEFMQILQPVVRKEVAAGYPLSRLLIRVSPEGFSLDTMPTE
ncbi:MAG: hypothetical protein EPN33_10160 [Acidobacteria bacterium]|nr:MAG: hypothetical protein EPN33_10160 [Acidobacteriota bacterium]